MKYKVRIDFLIVLLLDSFEVAHIQMCQGLNGTMCCFGYEWDQNQSMFIPCKKAYHCKNCDAKCPPLFFGLGCQSQCNCSKKECDYISGCRQLIKEQPYTFTIGSNYNVETTKLNDHDHSLNEKPNDTLFKDRTIIMQTVLTSKETVHHQSNSLMYAIIGVSVVVVLIIIYVYPSLLEKRKIPTSAV